MVVLHIILAAEKYESLAIIFVKFIDSYYELGSIADIAFQLILYNDWLVFCFSLSFVAYFLSNLKISVFLLPNAQDITTLRLKKKTASQSTLFHSAKSILYRSWVSVIFDRHRTAEQFILIACIQFSWDPDQLQPPPPERRWRVIGLLIS